MNFRGTIITPSTFWYLRLKSLFAQDDGLKTLSNAQTLKRAFICGKLKSLPDMPDMPQNKCIRRRKKEACSGNVVVHIGERYRDGYTWKSALAISYRPCIVTIVLMYQLDIQFYDDIKFYDSDNTRKWWTDVKKKKKKLDLMRRIKMLEYALRMERSFSFQYQKTTTTLLALCSRVTTFLLLSMRK